MKIEILFKEVANQYGDTGNIIYLETIAKTNKDVEIIHTSIHDDFKFLTEKIDLVYIGATTEEKFNKILEKFMNNREEILKKIHEGQYILGTGNAINLFVKNIILDRRYEEKNFNIVKENPKTIVKYNAATLNNMQTYIDLNKIPEKYIQKALGIIPLVAVTDMLSRYNGFTISEYTTKQNKKIELVGHRNSFTKLYPEKQGEHYYNIDSLETFSKVIRGDGINEDILYEGYHINNVFLTEMVGPFLVLNPLFTQELFKQFNIIEIPLFKEMLEAYEIRKQEFKDPNKMEKQSFWNKLFGKIG